jgi:crotonobetainyl-CoA:carnitine CoA-transferase CaiB-like acyl-CoA transferase
VVALDNLGERYTVGGEILTRAGNVSFAGSATGIYPAADGHVAVAAAASNAVWARFCAVIGRDELTRDPGFATAAARRDRDEIAAIIRTGPPRAQGGVVRRLATAGVPAAPVSNVAEMVADPRCGPADVRGARPSIYGPLTTTSTPLKLSETPGQVRWRNPMPGEHNEGFIGVLGTRAMTSRWPTPASNPRRDRARSSLAR